VQPPNELGAAAGGAAPDQAPGDTTLPARADTAAIP
jgi:hypothetical protein